MRSHTNLSTIALIITLAASPVVLAQTGPGYNGPGEQGGNGACQAALIDHLDLLPLGDLDDQELEAVLFLREEEKLARDVYLTLSLSWDLPVFSKIARSEQRHMNLVGLLIDRYGLTDPIVDDRIGFFSNSDLDAMYVDLTNLGEQSLVDALVVGAIIEDFDLADLYTMLMNSNDLDVDLIAENLSAGSRNHLRAFMGALETAGGSYEPQYIDQDTFDEILSSDRELGVIYDEFGEILAECNALAGGGNSGNGGDGGDGGDGGQGDQDGQGGQGGQGGNGNQGGNGGPGTGSGDCDGNGGN